MERATLIDPDNVNAWDDLAYTYGDLGDWTQMAVAAQALINIDPEFVDGVFTLAFARQQLHQYDLMVEAFDVALPLTPLDRQLVDSAGWRIAPWPSPHGVRRLWLRLRT